MVTSTHILRLSGEVWAAALARHEDESTVTLNAQVDVAEALSLPVGQIAVNRVASGSLLVFFTVSRNASQAIPDNSVNAILMASSFPRLQRQLRRIAGDDSLLVVPLSSLLVVPQAPPRELCDERCIITVVCVGCIFLVVMFIVVYCCWCRPPPQKVPPGGRVRTRGHLPPPWYLGSHHHQDAEENDDDDEYEEQVAVVVDGSTGRQNISLTSSGPAVETPPFGAEHHEAVVPHRRNEPDFSPETPEGKSCGGGNDSSGQMTGKNVSPDVPRLRLDFADAVGEEQKEGARRGTTGPLLSAHTEASSRNNNTSATGRSANGTAVTSASSRPMVRSWPIAPTDILPVASVRAAVSTRRTASSRTLRHASSLTSADLSAAERRSNQQQPDGKHQEPFSTGRSVTSSEMRAVSFSPGRPPARGGMLVLSSAPLPVDDDEIAVVTVAAGGERAGSTGGVDPVVTIMEDDEDDGRQSFSGERLQSGASLRIRKI